MAHELLYHSTLGSRVIKKKEENLGCQLEKRPEGLLWRRLEHPQLYSPVYGGGRGGKRSRNLFSLSPLSLSPLSLDGGLCRRAGPTTSLTTSAPLS